MRADVAPWSVARVGRSPSHVLARFTARKALRSGVLWGYVFGLTVASSALGYVSAYPTRAAREKFAATFGANPGLDAITGPATQIQTVAGYTVWKSLAFLSVLGGVWGLLLATRLFRGEEDAGRYELFLAGQTTRKRAAAQVLTGLGTGLAALYFVTALVAAVIGRESKVHVGVGAMAFFALAIVSGAAMFLGVGGLTSQLVSTRRQAAGYAGAALGVSYGVRMVADSGTGLGWLRWATPLGWIEELQPLTSPHPLALVPIGGLVMILIVATVHLAGTRDLGASIVPDRSNAKPRLRLLSGPVGLAVRLGRTAVLAWTFAIAATSLGFIAKQAGSAFSSTPNIERVLHKLGLSGSGAESYLGLSFLIVAVLVTFLAIGQVNGVRSDEADGHLEQFLVRPIARTRWLGVRLLTSLVIIVWSGVVAGTFTWFGATSQRAGVGFATLFVAGLNLVPPALFILGAAVLALGIYPCATSIVAYFVFVWSFLIELVGSLISSNHWFLDTSIFHQMAPAPAVTVDWSSDAVLVALGLGGAFIGGLLFRRRDLASA